MRIALGSGTVAVRSYIGSKLVLNHGLSTLVGLPSPQMVGDRVPLGLLYSPHRHRLVTKYNIQFLLRNTLLSPKPYKGATDLIANAHCGHIAG